jgi:hypothetical protein
LSLEVPIQNLFLYGRGVVPHCMSYPPPFPQFDLHCHKFVLCTPQRFLIWNNVRAVDVKTFPKAFVYKYICSCW